MKPSLLDKAEKALRKKRFTDVVAMLQSHVMEYDYSFRYYYLLATACLYLKDYKGAREYYKCARQIKPRSHLVILGNAVLFLRRGDVPSAIDCYLEVLEYEPTCIQAKKALEFIKKLDVSEDIQTYLDNGKLYRFFPPCRFFVSKKSKRLLILVAAACLVAVVVFYVYNFKLTAVPQRADLSLLELDTNEKIDPLELGGSYRYILTADELNDVFAAAKKSFQQYDDAKAQQLINKILYSNAQPGVKRKARLLMEYFSLPGFDTVKTNYTFAEVQKDPWLYIDCTVIWKGRATNIRVTEDNTIFDFLIGYENREKLEGIVPVVLTGTVSIDTNKPLSILGKISVEDKKIELKGISCYQPYAQ